MNVRIAFRRRRGFDRRGDVFGRRGDLRRLRGFWPPLHAVAERTQDRRKVFARGAGQRRHAVDDGKAAAGNRARRLRSRSTFAPRQRGADQIGQALQNIDAHRALAADPIAGGAVERRVDLAIDRDRGAAGAGEMQQIVEAFGLRSVMRQRP